MRNNAVAEASGSRRLIRNDDDLLFLLAAVGSCCLMQGNCHGPQRRPFSR
jgi:hypothetical protein